MELVTIGAETAGLRRDSSSIQQAVAQITKDTRHREMRCIERRSDNRLPFQRSVEVYALDDDGASVESDSPITAFTRDVSPSGIGLLHDQPIQSSRVLLRFELLGGGMAGLVVAMTWCRYLGDFWYSSGGRLVGSVLPIEESAESERGS